MKVSVIIPTMNEAESIGEVLDQIDAAFSASDLEYEAMIVDTSSTDGTPEIARSKGARVVDEPRRGYGVAYKTGFAAADGDIFATLDADCTYPAEIIPDLCRKLIDEDLEFITTNRFGDLEEGAMSPMHRFGNWVLTFTTNLLFRIRIKDSQSGMWVFFPEVLDRFELNSDGMPLSEEIKIEAMRKARAVEVPISYRRRVGDVKLSSWKDGGEDFFYLWRKRFLRPKA